MNPINELIRTSLSKLAVGQRVFNRAGDLRAAGVPIDSAITDITLVQHTAGDLHQKLIEAASVATDSDPDTVLE